MLFIVSKKQVLRVFIYFMAACVLMLIGIYTYSQTQSASKQDTKPQYIILIYIDEKRLYLLKDGNCIKQYPISPGMPDTPSPLGEWKIIEKGDWGEGFGGRWMGLNVKWGKYGIHGTTEQHYIGRAASHGCIRMFNKDVKELYDIVPIGTPVIIKSGFFGPFGTGFRELNPGDRGADVLAVQRRLKELGYFKGYESGIYEDDLKYALHKFQKEKQLEVKNAITRADYNAMGFIEFD